MYYDESIIDKFRILHSEIIEYYQCIEYDLRRIYSAMREGDYDIFMDELSDKNWGELLILLKRLDNSDGNPYFSDEEYDQLNYVRTRRNYWIHQCCIDFVYIQDESERNEKICRITEKLEREHYKAYNIHRKIQDYYLSDFV